MGSKRAAAAATAVLEMPEENVPAHEWHGGGPAPAGALQRYPKGYDEGEPTAAPREEEYVPRRGGVGFKWVGLMRSMGGRIVLGVTATVIIVVGLIGFVLVRYYLQHNDHFVISTSQDIQINGNEHLTRGQVLSVFGADIERNIFKVPLSERRADLERLPWVSHATVMRLLPNRLRITIAERTPVAFVRQGSQIGLVDANGVLLDMPSADAGNPQYSFPVLTGVAASDPLSVRAARMEVYQKFMKDLDSDGARNSQSLSEVDVTNPEDVKAIVASGGMDVLVHFGEQDFLQRYKQLEQNLPAWKQQYPKLAAADMRYQGQVVLEMQHGAATPLAGDATAQPAPTTAPTVAEAKPAEAPKMIKAPVAKVKASAKKPVAHGRHGGAGR